MNACHSLGKAAPGRGAAACAALLAALTALPLPAAAEQIGAEVMLVNAKTAKCMTIAGGVSTDNNVDAVQYDCDADPSRRWTLREVRSGIYQVVNVQTGKCLTIAGGVSTDNNVRALQYDCDTHPSRTWRIGDVTGTGIHQLRNVQTNKCLTIAGGTSPDNNLQGVQYNCDADTSRRWIIRVKLRG
jgi:phosphoribosylanthranilate isomerase